MPQSACGAGPSEPKPRQKLHQREGEFRAQVVWQVNCVVVQFNVHCTEAVPFTTEPPAIAEDPVWVLEATTALGDRQLD